MMKATIGCHKMLYSCEIDCIKEKLDRGPRIDDFVELKTAAPIRDQRTGLYADWFRRITSRRWWSQCSMAGIDQVVVGIKDQPKKDRHTKSYIHCKRVEIVQISDLRKNAIGWSAKSGFRMLIKFLDKVKEVVTEDNPDVVYLFTVETRKDITFERLTASDHEQFPIVTEAMIEKLNKLSE